MAEFDQFGTDYEERLQSTLAGMGDVDLAVRSKVQLLGDLLPAFHALPVPRLLDFGCGVGLLTRELGRFAETVIGVDPSLDSLAHGEFGDGRAVAYDGVRLPFDDGAFDVAVASCVFHHIQPGDRDGVLGELHRVLTDQGLLVIIEHNPRNPVTRWIVNRCEFDRDAVLLSPGEVKQRFEAAGLEHQLGHYFFTVPPATSWLHSVDRSLKRLGLGAHFVSVGRRAPRPDPAGP